MMNQHLPKRQGVTLWLGGTSSLARTYVNEFGSENLVLVGSRPQPPRWVRECSTPYVTLDLVTVTSSQAESIMKTFPEISTIIVGVRPRLFTAFVDINLHLQMVKGLEVVVEAACQKLKNLKFILHLSSVAAADHLQSQKFWSESEPLPDIADYKAPYDIFKRQSEEHIRVICKIYRIPSCHFRLSAIFSDENACIQCSALDLQCRIGCYLPLPIDCNSSLNVSRAIDLMLARSEREKDHQQAEGLETIYYYTRPLLLKAPVPYGYYLQEFRRASCVSAIWIPVFVVNYFVACVHWLARTTRKVNIRIPYLEAGDYLLQVASREHSFDCQVFAADFPELREESIYECFVRRKDTLTSYHSVKSKSQ